ncbi:hypothetical protein RHABOEDO_000396 [Candidatus Rhabdochlamydia oedothoracis]|uniref:Globin family profile domain-containing protein n=2 Tax=Candidatus Rhabdochlamydia oedothoracis TaxID=2720720 RepID=A0ABX8UZ78_9BACT|nr:hypothetical protein [Candidatus Rhabdochlamydia sp. W815]KAG6559000.1 hypothetical protein RHOW815_001007 [Candidatus Rhabdochlamydia sp. W815]QYF48269.1 hypothetical protein RHABOEDO_000396 [Candidatus Rhabdochlamydia oedothoracis]
MSIPPSNSEPYKKIIVNRVEQNKKSNNSFSQFPTDLIYPNPASILVCFFKKFTMHFSFKNKISTAALKQDLLELKQLFISLSIEDLSHQLEFIQKLSLLWHKIIKDCNPISLSLSKGSDFLKKIADLIQIINHFPANEDHSLGYYLQEHVGEKWVPFPFMELLQELHIDYQKTQDKSYLADWIKILSSIIDKLLSNAP